jgi:hypothetical protein
MKMGLAKLHNPVSLHLSFVKGLGSNNEQAKQNKEEIFGCNMLVQSEI